MKRNTRPSSEEDWGCGICPCPVVHCSPLGESCVSDSFWNSPGWFLKHLPLWSVLFFEPCRWDNHTCFWIGLKAKHTSPLTPTCVFCKDQSPSEMRWAGCLAELNPSGVWSFFLWSPWDVAKLRSKSTCKAQYQWTWNFLGSLCK